MSRADRAGSSPARFAEPRALFIVAAVALTAFGLVMIFSASSIMALTSEATHFDPTYYVPSSERAPRSSLPAPTTTSGPSASFP